MALSGWADTTVRLSRSRITATVQPVTLSIWANFSANGNLFATYTHWLFNNESDNSSSLGWNLNAGGTRISIYSAGDSHSSTFTADTGVWHHYASRWDTDNSVEHFRDGTSIGTASIAAASTISADSCLGVIGSGLGIYTQGSLSEFGMWSAVLTNAEIAALAKGCAPSLVRPTGLMSYVPLVRSDGIDHKLGAWTITGSPTVQSHTPVILPKRRRFYSVPAAAVSSTVARLVNRGLVGSGLVNRGRLV